MTIPMTNEANLNELGLPVLVHWMNWNCTIIAPGDVTTDQVKEVTCGNCQSEFTRIRAGQEAMMINRGFKQEE